MVQLRTSADIYLFRRYVSYRFFVLHRKAPADPLLSLFLSAVCRFVDAYMAFSFSVLLCCLCVI
jgi:hypothetical protein